MTLKREVEVWPRGVSVLVAVFVYLLPLWLTIGLCIAGLLGVW